MDSPITFGDWLRQRRKTLDLTQEDLASRVGCSAETIRKMEAGTRRPSRQIAELLSKELAVPGDQRPAFVEFARTSPLEDRASIFTSAETPAQRLLTGPIRILPTPLTTFIGRHREIEAVGSKQWRADVRLITLTGEGGSGKTRLAIQVAASVLSNYKDGVCFVSLAAIKDPNLVTSTIARTLGIPEISGRPLVESLRDYLADKHLLLVLDNFEQVLDAAVQVGQLLADAQKLKVLVTSREPLHLYGEHIFSVPPLTLPRHQDLQSPVDLLEYEATDLFLQRVMLVKPDFTLTGDNAPAILEICERLDGLPLAIELAAARVKLFPPQAILSRIENRLDLLTGGPRDQPTRQQTLRNAIEWSYDLLEEGEKQLFRRMAPFNGGRTIKALEAVCNYDGQLLLDVFDGVQSIFDQSLLKLRKGHDGEPRFWMLETIHEYAREKLEESGEAEDLSRSHALYFMALAEEAEPHLRSARQQEWLDRLEDDHDNLRTALTWATQGSLRGGEGHPKALEMLEIGLRIGGAMWRFWLMKGYLSEGSARLEGLLRAADQLGRLKRRSTITALNGAGYLAWRLGDYRAADSMLQIALELGRELGDEKGVALALCSLGNVAYAEEEYNTARARYQESLALSRKLGDKSGISASLHNLGNLAHAQGDYAGARALYEEGLILSRELGDKWGIANTLNNLGIVTSEQGDNAAAYAQYQESLAIKRELGDKWGITALLNNLGNLAWSQGNYSEARTLLIECLSLKRELGHKWGIATTLTNLGHVAYVEGDYNEARALYKESLVLSRELADRLGIVVNLAGIGGALVGTGRGDARNVQRGAVLLGAVEGLMKTLEEPLEREDRLPYEHGVAAARTRLDEGTWREALTEGQVMSVDQASAYALNEF